MSSITHNIHPIATIFKNINLLEFRFNHISSIDYPHVSDCNYFFPTKNRHSQYITNTDYSNSITPIPYQDSNLSFFLHIDRGNDTDLRPWSEKYNDPDFIITHYKLFEITGETRYWKDNKPQYPRTCLRPYHTDESLLLPSYESIPIDVSNPINETGTDRERRLLNYRQNRCIWGLLDCHCSTNGGSLCIRKLNKGPPCIYGDGYRPTQLVNLRKDTSKSLKIRIESMNHIELTYWYFFQRLPIQIINKYYSIDEIKSFINTIKYHKITKL